MDDIFFLLPLSERVGGTICIDISLNIGAWTLPDTNKKKSSKFLKIEHYTHTRVLGFFCLHYQTHFKVVWAQIVLQRISSLFTVCTLSLSGGTSWSTLRTMVDEIRE